MLVCVVHRSAVTVTPFLLVEAAISKNARESCPHELVDAVLTKCGSHHSDYRLCRVNPC